MKAIRLIIIILLLIACSKENDFKSAGTITGYDVTMCACCGGWVIIIEDIKYLIDSMPKDSEIDLTTETFPVKVSLDWQLVDSGCSSFNRIIVTKIKKL